MIGLVIYSAGMLVEIDRLRSQPEHSLFELAKPLRQWKVWAVFDLEAQGRRSRKRLVLPVVGGQSAPVLAG